MWFVFLFLHYSVSFAQTATQDQSPTPSSSTCDRDMIQMSDSVSPRIQGVRDLCQQHPDILMSSIKLQLTRYLCLYHSDLECLKKTQTFLASYNQGQRSARLYAADFERIVGSRYVNFWLNDDPNKNYNHPALRNSFQYQESSLDTDGSLEAMSSVASMISKVVPYGNALELAVTGLGALTSMGQAEVSPDPNNTCSTARDAYINATPQGRSCIPSFNFNSEPVARFLRQPADRQAQGLKCHDTCRYYAGLLATLEKTNSVIMHFAMPLLESRPQCLSGGRVSFSFESLKSSSVGNNPMGPARSITPLSWKGMVTELSASGKSYQNYYRFQNEVTPPGSYLRWQVTGDMLMRNKISATVTPQYTLGMANVQLSIPQVSRNSRRGTTASLKADQTIQYLQPYNGDQTTSGFTTPRWQVGSMPRVEVSGLHQHLDPAIQGMGLAAALVTGCCSVPNPNQNICLDGLQTVERLRRVERSNPTSSPTDIKQ